MSGDGMGPDEPVEDRPSFEAIRRLIRGMLPSALFKERWSAEPYTVGQVPAVNASGKFAPATLLGGAATFGAPGFTLGTADAAGTTAVVVASDATIAAFDATVPVTQAMSDAAATGSAAKAARRDHKHGMPASAAPSGAAGGDLSGTYPNPSVTDDSHGHTSATVTTHSTAHANDHVRSHDLESGSDHTTSSGVDGHFMRQTGATSFTFEADYYMVTFLLSSTSALTTGIYADIMIPSAGVLEEWNLLLDAADTMTVTCTFCTYAGYDTFGAFTPALAPATAAVIKATSGALTTAVAAKDIIRFNLSAAGGVAKRLSLNLWVRKS